jgi:hypothetical protein
MSPISKMFEVKLSTFKISQIRVACNPLNMQKLEEISESETKIPNCITMNNPKQKRDKKSFKSH